MTMTENRKHQEHTTPYIMSLTSRYGNTSFLVGCTGLTLVATVAAYVWLYQCTKKEDESLTPQDLMNNSSATGSDVLRVYSGSIKHKTFVVTGVTSGLGKQTSLLLAKTGGHIVLGARRTQEATDVARQIESIGGSAEVIHLDLASLTSVRDFSNQVKNSLKSQGRKIDVLINNAGVLGVDGPSEDGFQMVWQVNALAPMLLTELLLPILTEDGRVVNVSSEMHRMCSFINSIPDLCPPPSDRGSGSFDYAFSKACQILHSRALNMRFQSHPDFNQRKAFAIEPGLVQTEIGRNLPQFLLRLEHAILGPFFMRTVDQGCSSTLYCALAPLSDLFVMMKKKDSDPFQCYFANCAPKRPVRNCCRDEVAHNLMTVCSQLLQIEYNKLTH